MFRYAQYITTYLLPVPPRFRQRAPSVLTAVSGDDVVLSCDVDGEPEPAISWRKNQAAIDFTRGDHQYLIEHGGSSLIIPAADVDDAARYLCVAENAAGVVTQETNLIVYGQWLSDLF